jgi:tetratricopeptide (TPR) repeat protein
MSDSNEGKTQNYWMIKDGEGRVFGPLSNSTLNLKIDSGQIIGTELVSAYPGGRWTPISTSPAFADRILDALDAEFLVHNGFDAPSEISPEEEAAEKTIIDMRPIPAPNSASNQAAVQGGNDASGVASGLGHSVPSEFYDPEFAKVPKANGQGSRLVPKKMKIAPKAAIAIGTIVLGGLFLSIFLGGGKTSGNRIHLLMPRRSQAEISDDKTKEKFKRALAAFQSDMFSGYQRAQNDLVEIIEGASMAPEQAQRRAEMYSTLCLVYRELWNYSYQDASDLKAVNEVKQEAKKLDPAGLHGGICEIVNLMVNGRTREAQSLTDSMLLDESQAPVLFELRGDQYLIAGDTANAANYFNQARTLWPAWRKTAIQEARARAAQKQYSPALELYRDVLLAVPKHSLAKIEMSLIEYEQFAHSELAFNNIKSALESGERVPNLSASVAYMALANISLERNQKKRSLEYARKAYSMNASNQEAKDLIVRLAGKDELKNTKIEGRELLFIGEQHERMGDFFSAQAEYKAAFDSDTKNSLAALKAAKCLRKLNQNDDAIEWLKKAIQSDASLTAAYVELADSYAQRFDFLAATRALQKIQTLQPKNYQVYRGFAQVELRRNNFSGARGFAEKAIKYYDNDLETLTVLARANLGLRDYQTAHSVISRGLEIDINNIEAQVIYAQVEAGLHGVDAGVQYLKNLLNRIVVMKGQSIPQSVIEYRNALGDLCLQDERYAQAEEAFRQVISLDSNSKAALMGLAKSVQAQGRFPEALEIFLKAAVLEPSDAEPIYRSGEVYSEVGKFADAINQFERVIKNNPRYPKAHVALGRSAMRAGNPKRALEEAMQERLVNPEMAEAYLLAAEAYYELKQFGNCAVEYQKAVSKKALGANILIRMARCYRLTGALDSAQSLLRQAQAIESGQPDLYKEQGAIFHLKGMAEEALTAYETYLKLAPGAPDKAEVSGLIKRIQSGDMTFGEGG